VEGINAINTILPALPRNSPSPKFLPPRKKRQARRVNVLRHILFIIFIGARLAAGHFVYRHFINTLYVNILRHHLSGSS